MKDNSEKQKEEAEGVVGQTIAYYPISLEDSEYHPIYGEAIGTQRWQKGARLKIAAQPVRTSKSGKQYQTASMIELLSGEVAVPTGKTSNATGKDLAAQWKEKYRLTMSNLLSAALRDITFSKVKSPSRI